MDPFCEDVFFRGGEWWSIIFVARFAITEGHPARGVIRFNHPIVDGRFVWLAWSERLGICVKLEKINPAVQIWNFVVLVAFGAVFLEDRQDLIVQWRCLGGIGDLEARSEESQDRGCEFHGWLANAAAKDGNASIYFAGRFVVVGCLGSVFAEGEDFEIPGIDASGDEFVPDGTCSPTREFFVKSGISEIAGVPFDHEFCAGKALHDEGNLM